MDPMTLTSFTALINRHLVLVSMRSWVRYPVWQHTFVSPSAFSRKAVVSYWRKYVHEVLVNRLRWLVGCFGFNGLVRQYFSLYRVVSQREGERGERIDESKNVQTAPTRTYCKRNRPLPYCYQNCRTPRHWKFTQHHRITRPPQPLRRSKPAQEKCG